MNRDQAMRIVQEYVKNENLIRHMLSVEAAMRYYALKFGENEELWGITGLLHDFDWEIHPTLEEHPKSGASILRQRGVSEEIVLAILTCRPYRRPSIIFNLLMYCALTTSGVLLLSGKCRQ